MIQKIYEDRYGIVKWCCITKDLLEAKSKDIYNGNKTTGSLMINIEDFTNSLIWDNENKVWLNCDLSEFMGNGLEVLMS